MLLRSALFFALLTFASAVPRPGFHVGTAEGLKDVIENGEVTPHWAVDGDTELLANDQKLEFYVWLEKHSVGGDEQAFRITNETDIAGIYDIDFWAHGGTVREDETFVLPLHFACLHDGYTKTRVTFVMEDWDPVVVSFLKECTWPKIHMGLARGVPTVMEDGVPIDEWDFTAGIHNDHTTFFVWLSDDNMYPRLDYDVYEPSWDPELLAVEIEYIGDPPKAAWKLAPGRQESGIVVKYKCLKPEEHSSSWIFMRLAVGFSHELPLVWGWKKECGPIPVNPRPGFRIGTTPSGNEVARNGLVNAEWDPLTPKLLEPDTQFFELYVSISKEDVLRPAPRFQPYSVNYTQQGGDSWVVYDLEVVNSTGVMEEGGADYSIFLLLDCRNSDIGDTTMTFLVPPYDPVMIKFHRQCIWPSLQIASNPDRRADIVVDSEPTGSTHFVSAEEESVTFYMWLDHQKEPELIQQHFYLHEIEFDPNFVIPLFSLPKGNVVKPIGLGPVEDSELVLTFECVKNVESVNNITVVLHVGWLKDIEFTLIKHCRDFDTPSSGGWSGFAIFSLTVFLLGTIFCMGGCAYKYITKGERGWAIVPGNTYFLACWDRLFPVKTAGPQSDGYFDDSASTYQTDL